MNCSYLQYTTAGSAHIRTYCHIYICGSSLTTVKAVPVVRQGDHSPQELDSFFFLLLYRCHFCCFLYELPWNLDIK